MENIDFIILTTIISISFIVFGVTTFNEFKKASEKDKR